MTTPHGTAGWADFQAAEPAFARTVQDRFARYQHHVLATLRRDGSPRLTGLEADFRFDQLWLGMMHRSWKALDLRRDPRFALHANPGPDTEMREGDVRVEGRAVEETDPEVIADYVAAARPPEPFHLFRAALTGVVRVAVEGEELVVQHWRPSAPLRTVRRRADEDPAAAEHRA